MKKCLALVCVGLGLGALEGQAQFAGAVISYNAGTDAAPGFNDPTRALGEPSRFTNDPGFPGPVDPYNAAYLPSQIVSVGTGGSLTLQMSSPVRNDPLHPFGLDFIVYGNAGLGADFVTGLADGTLYGQASPGQNRVSVSADGTQFYTLDTSLAPVVDRYYPTDGQGVFGRAVNPALTGADFNGLTMDGIRALYDRSAGGAGYDLAWARDGLGNAVSLSEINFVRVEVSSFKAEIDGIAAVPEPATWALLGVGAAALLIRKRK